MDNLLCLSKLIRKKNQVDDEIARLILRPAQIGHVGEYIASAVFDIQLLESASHKAIDGYFSSNALVGQSVNIKWYGKMEYALDITPDTLPDYYLVMTGPISVALSSRAGTRPWLIHHIFLFPAPDLVADLSKSNRKIGIATSVPKQYWEHAEIYPRDCSPFLTLSVLQKELLKLFGAE